MHQKHLHKNNTLSHTSSIIDYSKLINGKTEPAKYVKKEIEEVLQKPTNQLHFPFHFISKHSNKLYFQIPFLLNFETMRILAYKQRANLTIALKRQSRATCKKEERGYNFIDKVVTTFFYLRILPLVIITQTNLQIKSVLTQVLCQKLPILTRG